MGWCTVCERLLFIRPGAQKWGSREVEWLPVDHAALRHRGCGGVAKYVASARSNVIIGDAGGSPEDDVPSYACSSCGAALRESELDADGPCPGVRREIR